MCHECCMHESHQLHAYGLHVQVMLISCMFYNNTAYIYCHQHYPLFSPFSASTIQLATGAFRHLISGVTAIVHGSKEWKGVLGCNAGVGGGGSTMNTSILSEQQISTSSEMLVLRKYKHTASLQPLL